MSGTALLKDDDFYQDLALQAAYDDDLDILRQLLVKFPIKQGDIEWLGYLMEDYIAHLSPEGAQLLIDAGIGLNHAD